MTLAEYLRDKRPGGFKPTPWLNIDGAQIHWLWEDVPCHSESVLNDGAWVGTIHRADDDKRVVGVNVHMEAVRGGLFLLEHLPGKSGGAE